jgi:hypothetical protein
MIMSHAERKALLTPVAVAPVVAATSVAAAVTAAATAVATTVAILPAWPARDTGWDVRTRRGDTHKDGALP